MTKQSQTYKIKEISRLKHLSTFLEIKVSISGLDVVLSHNRSHLKHLRYLKFHL